MKQNKYLLLSLTLSLFVLGSCNKTETFSNPGDFLGGGGTGEIVDSASDGTDNVKDDFLDDDFTNLSNNTSLDDAIFVEPTNDGYTILNSGTYLFKGSYGGLALGDNSLNVHLIFDGAKIESNTNIALNGADYKKEEVLITLIGENSIISNTDSENAIHIKGKLSFNGQGSLNVESTGKNAIKVSKELVIVDATLNLTADNHAIAALSISANNCKINVISAGKDGLNAECDDETTTFTTNEGYVYLKDVNYTCQTKGDGIQVDSVVYIDGGNYNIKTIGNFVSKTQMNEYDLTTDDFKYIKVGSNYQRIASDEANRYSASQLYGLAQGCKGIKVGEIEYPDENFDKEIPVTEGDYSIIIEKGTFVIDSTDDAIHANSGNLSINGGDFTISTFDDGITSDILTKINGGNITINKSYEGIEGGYVEITGGKINITSSDDGINAASDDKSVIEHIIISGGEITVNAEGDGVDSNGSINMTSGTLIIFGPTSGANAALDADRGIVIDGGYLFAVGPLGMVETPASNSKQNVLSYAQNQVINANTILSLTDKDGKTIFSVTIIKNCQSVIVSCPELIMDASFTLYGGSSELCSFTVNNVITKVGSQGNMGNPGGTPPGGFGGGFGGGKGPGGR